MGVTPLRGDDITPQSAQSPLCKSAKARSCACVAPCFRAQGDDLINHGLAQAIAEAAFGQTRDIGRGQISARRAFARDRHLFGKCFASTEGGIESRH